jgi:nucleoid-associated protein YgaU
MQKSRVRFCALYRPIGALILLLIILFLLLRACAAPAPVAVPTIAAPTVPAPTVVAPTVALPTVAAPTVAVPTIAAPTVGAPTAAPTVAVPTVAAPTVVAPTAAPVALPKINAPAPADFTADGVKLTGTGQSGETVEVWDGVARLGTVKVGADGTWALTGKLAEGSHKLLARTVDAAGKTLNEAPAVDVVVPKMQTTTPTPDLTAAGQVHIVKEDDWLSKLAQIYYGDARLYTLIIEGTNAKAAVDPTFTKITDPNRIELGQKLWIPARPAGS